MGLKFAIILDKDANLWTSEWMERLPQMARPNDIHSWILRKTIFSNDLEDITPIDPIL